MRKVLVGIGQGLLQGCGCVVGLVLFSLPFNLHLFNKGEHTWWTELPNTLWEWGRAYYLYFLLPLIAIIFIGGLIQTFLKRD